MVNSLLLCSLIDSRSWLNCHCVNTLPQGPHSKITTYYHQRGLSTTEIRYNQSLLTPLVTMGVCWSVEVWGVQEGGAGGPIETQGCLFSQAHLFAPASQGWSAMPVVMTGLAALFLDHMLYSQKFLTPSSTRDGLVGHHCIRYLTLLLAKKSYHQNQESKIPQDGLWLDWRNGMCRGGYNNLCQLSRAVRSPTIFLRSPTQRKTDNPSSLIGFLTFMLPLLVIISCDLAMWSLRKSVYTMTI